VSTFRHEPLRIAWKSGVGNVFGGRIPRKPTNPRKPRIVACARLKLMRHQRPYEKLVAWQEAYKLCLWVYRLTKKFPTDERFRLVSQMCWSAYGVSLNIAESNARRSQKDKAHFLEVALSSLEELHCQRLLAKDLRYIEVAEFEKTDDHVQRVSYLITRLRAAVV
jgi:four helix bundle protein